MKEKDPYEVLGLSRDTPFNEVRARYFRLARKHHPDKLGHVTEEERRRHEEIFKEITAAYDAIESGNDGTGAAGGGEGNRDWRTVWSRVETLFQKPEVWDCMRKVLQGTLEDVATKTAERKRKERLVHTMYLNVSLEELHQGKQKKLELILHEVKTPVYVKVSCRDYPCAKVLQVINGDTHTINIHMTLQNHQTYRFDDLLGKWDLYATTTVSWTDFIQGRKLVLPSLEATKLPLEVSIPPFPRMDVPIVIAGKGVANRGDLYIHLDWQLPTPECWDQLDDSDKNNFLRTLNALTA